MIETNFLRHWKLIAIAALALLAWHFHGLATDRATALKQQAESFEAAQKEAGVLAAKARRDAEARYAEITERVEREHLADLADARAAADRYIAAHRLRPQADQGGSIGSTASTKDRASAIRAGLPATGVVVSERDVQACTDATAYALALREWALEITR